MLNIHFKPLESTEKEQFIVDDIFSKTIISGTEFEKNIIRTVDKGEYLNNTHFIDRFGTKLSRYDLSTGCQVALSVLNNPDICIDTLECGINAIAAIVAYCNNGNILILDNDATIPRVLYHNGEIDVMLEGKHFKTLHDLNEYITMR